MSTTPTHAKSTARYFAAHIEQTVIAVTSAYRNSMWRICSSVWATLPVPACGLWRNRSIMETRGSRGSTFPIRPPIAKPTLGATACDRS